MDNAVLWSVLAGTWASADGRWQASIREDNGIVLSLDSETVLRAPLYFTYLQPGQIIWTEITLENGTLVTPDGVSLGEIKSFGHEAENGEPSGALVLRLERPDDSEETVTFRKTQE